MTTHYRLTHIDLSTRLQLAMQMINTQRPWGTVTTLADNYQVSRKFLYQLSHKATSATTITTETQRC
jgi:hypothetical protein